MGRERAGSGRGRYMYNASTGDLQDIMKRMAEDRRTDVHIEERSRSWHVVCQKPGFPPRIMTSNLAILEAQRAEYTREPTLAAKLKKAAAEARRRNELT